MSFQLFKVGVKSRSWELRSPARFNLIFSLKKCFNKGVGQVSWNWKTHTLPFWFCVNPHLSQAAPRIVEQSPGFEQSLSKRLPKTPNLEVNSFLQLFVLPIQSYQLLSFNEVGHMTIIIYTPYFKPGREYQKRNRSWHRPYYHGSLINSFDYFFTVFLPVHCSTEILLLPLPKISGMTKSPKKCLTLTCLAPTYTVRISTLPNITFKVLMTGFSHLGPNEFETS